MQNLELRQVQSNQVITLTPDQWNEVDPIYSAIGRRKESTAQVFLKPGLQTGKITINKKPCEIYLCQNFHFVLKIKQPLLFLEDNLNQGLDIEIFVKGGGLRGQVDAIHLAISRALCSWKQEFRPGLKKKGFLTRDARVKERKKYGLKKARKAPQYSKR